MLFLIIGIAVLVAGIIIFVKFKNPILFVVGLFGLAVAFGFGISSISGYEEPVLQETYELKPIYEPSTYIIEDSSGAVTCKHVIKNEHPEAIESYGKYTYSPIDFESMVGVVVTEKGSKPIMKKYFEKARKTIWTFAVNCDKVKYVFYVPEENIERWQNVHVN